MNPAILSGLSTTAQVRVLCEELLSDGRPHARKDMEKYIVEQMTLFGLPAPTHGCLAGGIRLAVQRMNCDKPGTAVYQATVPFSPAAPATRKERAADCLQSAISTLSALAREIDYIDATPEEADELLLFKKGIDTLKEFRQKLAE